MAIVIQEATPTIAATAILDKVKAIAAAPFQSNNDYQPKALLSGLMGRAIFLGHLWQYTGEEGYRQESLDTIDTCINALADEPMTHTYCNGVTGIAAGLFHLAATGILEDDPAEMLEDIDQNIYEFGVQDFANGNWDFLHGGLGAFWYFLNRPDYTKHTAYFDVYLDLLEAQAESTPYGYRWLMKPMRPEDQGKKLYSVGLSHGLPSIVMVLAHCVQKKVLLHKSLPLLQKAAGHLRHLQLPEEAGSVFPSMEEEDSVRRASRLAWCYGDLSIAIVLYAAADALEDDSLLQLAAHTATATLNRDVSNSSVVDAGVCHGAGGVAQLYWRLYTITGQISYYNRSKLWLAETMRLAEHPDGIAGYKSYMGEEGFQLQSSLLEGVTGIGLALLSAIAPGQANWDTLILVS
jgi:lantibiotic biosynthesis protein